MPSETLTRLLRLSLGGDEDALHALSRLLVREGYGSRLDTPYDAEISTREIARHFRSADFDGAWVWDAGTVSLRWSQWLYRVAIKWCGEDGFSLYVQTQNGRVQQSVPAKTFADCLAQIHRDIERAPIGPGPAATIASCLRTWTEEPTP